MPHRIFAGDPAWIAPLDRLERRRISSRHNPFFATSEAALFVATRDGEPVGRISAQVNSRYLARHNNDVGHFGFYETIDDEAVSAILLDTAAEWLRSRGMLRMEGPFNLSINEECGLLVDGFETRPTVMMPHSARWQAPLIQQAGFAAVMDLHAFRFDTDRPPRIVAWLSEAARHDSAVSIRSFSKRDLDADWATMIEIFNDAWYDNWGFVPFSPDDIRYLFGELRPFFRDHYGKFVCLDGRPVGFALAAPNINEIIAGFGGRLFPLNWAKLVYALGFEKFRSGRLPLLGLRREFQGQLRGAGMFAALMKSAIEDVSRYRLDWMEFSWVLASNRPLVTFLRSTTGEPAKNYRIFGREL